MKRLFFLMMILVLLSGVALAESAPVPEQVTEIILGFQETYPDKYLWNGEETGNNPDFLLMVSDAAFGSLPSRKVEPVDYGALHPGDILRLKNDTYSVMIVKKFDSYATVVEVWTNGRVYWGRTLSRSAVEAGDYVMTRYPE